MKGKHHQTDARSHMQTKPTKDHHQQRRRHLSSSPNTTMNRLPTSLPERLRSTLPDTFDLALVPQIPITTRPSWHHLVFDSTRMTEEKPHNSRGERTEEQHDNHQQKVIKYGNNMRVGARNEGISRGALRFAKHRRP